MSKVYVIAFVAGLALSACERFPLSGLPISGHAAQEKTDRQKLQLMRAGIDSLVGLAPCDSVADCRYTGLGAKPCGGPQGYLVYSVARTDTALLAAKVAEYNRFEQEMNRTYGYISDCAMPMEPVLGRVDGRCVDLHILSSVQLRELELVDSFEGLEKTDPYDKSLPLRHPLRLTHKANGDACEAYIEEELRFDLSPLRQIHAGQDEVLLYLDNPDSLIEYRLGNP